MNVWNNQCWTDIIFLWYPLDPLDPLDKDNQPKLFIQTGYIYLKNIPI
jgi:hypothetical protein